MTDSECDKQQQRCSIDVLSAIAGLPCFNRLWLTYEPATSCLIWSTLCSGDSTVTCITWPLLRRGDPAESRWETEDCESPSSCWCETGMTWRSGRWHYSRPEISGTESHCLPCQSLHHASTADYQRLLLHCPSVLLRLQSGSYLQIVTSITIHFHFRQSTNNDNKNSFVQWPTLHKLSWAEYGLTSHLTHFRSQAVVPSSGPLQFDFVKDWTTRYAACAINSNAVNSTGFSHGLRPALAAAS